MRGLAMRMTAMLAAAAFGGADAEPSLRERIAKTRRVVGEDVWYGHRRVKFDFDGRTAWVVEPSVAPAEGRPWTWTMQWSEAFVDRTGVPELLRRGFHHVTIDLFDTRMDAAGIAAAAAFQRFLVETLGFAPKARLIGMSWGGFFSTRYAAAHPDRVERIYLDAPLLNLDALDAGAGTPDDASKRIGPWTGRRPAEGWIASPETPVNLAERLAAAKIPVLLVYGGQDRTVDPRRSAEPFAERFRAAGGEIKVVLRKLFGHHPHGFDPDKTAPVLEFFGAK